jgi:hypothetical protein
VATWITMVGVGRKTCPDHLHPMPDGECLMPQFATSEAELEAIYGSRDTAVATIKEIDHISDHYRMFIEASPFVLVATAGPEGLDCSPRAAMRPVSCASWTGIPSCCPTGAATIALMPCAIWCAIPASHFCFLYPE